MMPSATHLRLGHLSTPLTLEHFTGTSGPAEEGIAAVDSLVKRNNRIEGSAPQEATNPHGLQGRRAIPRRNHEGNADWAQRGC